MNEKHKGRLIMASNSIGNNLDIPNRSLEHVREADLIVFEEDKPARQVLKTAKVHREYLKYSEHNQESTLVEVRNKLKEGKTVCYMSDQGVPTLADPGKQLLEIAAEVNASIFVIPGPSSITSTLSACSFLTPKFYYLGFLPREEADRENYLKSLVDFPDCMVILDTPYRLKQLLTTLKSIFPPKRKILIARDISCEGEEYINSKLESIDIEKIEGKKNFVLVLQGAQKNSASTTFIKRKSKPSQNRRRKR